MADIEEFHVPFGEPTGSDPSGVVAYSNFSDQHFSGERNFDGAIFTGFKWQCVEYARRYLLERKGLYLPDIPWAAHIFLLKEVHDVRTGEAVPVVAVRNGTKEPPVPDSLLIYPSEEGAIVGHVAAISEVSVGDEGGYIRICDQNLRFHKWYGNYSAQLTVTRDVEGNYHVRDSDPEHPENQVEPLGWVTFPSAPNRDPSVPLTFHESFHDPVYPAPYLERVTFTPESTTTQWLDMAEPAERIFADKWNYDVGSAGEIGKARHYYRANMELLIRFVASGNQLHQLFLQATKNVMQDPKLLARLGIPKEFWGRLRRSFVNQRKTIMGRFDFGVCGEQLKLYNYNADTVDTLFECAHVQQKWAEHVKIAENTRASGGRIFDLLINAWKQTQLAGTVHFVTSGTDKEELYNATYVASAAAKAGFATRVCDGIGSFRWRDGHIVDADGTLVRIVWKSQPWDAAFEDYREAQTARPQGWCPSNDDTVRLCDLLLGDEAIKVFEPLWKAVTASKGILPVVFGLNPQHPAMLETSFELTDAMRSKGYVRKPIGGRYGQNITIFGKDGRIVADTSKDDSRFTTGGFIFQEFLEVPEHASADGSTACAVINGWQIGDHFGGSGVSESATRISTSNDPFCVLRMALNFVPKPITRDNVDEERRARIEAQDAAVRK